MSHGFKVNLVYPGNMVIDFSGNAGQIRGAFHTAIHRLDVNGVHHIANISDPQIPEALAPVVAGVISMHDFGSRKMSRAKRSRAATRAQYSFSSSGTTYEALVPADLATIYNFNPLFANGVTGKGPDHRGRGGYEPLSHFGLDDFPHCFRVFRNTRRDR